MKILMIQVIIGLLINTLLYAEIIDGPANVRKDINSKILFNLYDSVEVEVIGKNGDWFRIAIFVSIHKNDLESENEDFLKPNIKIYDSAYKESGSTESKTEFILFGEDKADYIQGYIIGMTYKGNIRSNSISEPELLKILHTSKKPYSFDTFSEYLKRLDYREWISDTLFSTYILYAPTFLDPSPGARNILIFYNNTLMAIIYDKDSNLNIFNNKVLVQNYNYVIFYENDPDVVSKCIKKYTNIIKYAD
ncbi:MAG: hypothetical protein ACT6FE_08375 [Methanosarcinaceae archaeon]